MTRHSVRIGLVIVGAACVLPSCHLTTPLIVDAPPGGDPAGNTKWWVEKVDRLDPGLRAVYLAAADTHRARGTSATYVDRHACRTMMGGIDTELRLPCPPPLEAFPLLRSQVKPGDSSRGAGRSGHVTAEAGAGCSAEEADAIWREAIATVRKADPAQAAK